MFDFVGKKRWFFLGSAVLLIAGIISLILPGGLKPGIEFKGGTSITVHFAEPITEDEVSSKLAYLGYGESIIQNLGEGDFFIRTRLLEDKEQKELREGIGGEVGEFNAVSAIVAGETMGNAGIAVVVAAVAILLYITWAFRRMPSPFRYGTCAIIALIHDILVVLGVFSLLGRAFNWEIDPMFVTAVLAVIGYSVNDTIVVFDRIRENLTKQTNQVFESIVNSSLVQTLGRSLNTSVTTILVVLAVYLFVGGTIRNFVLALLIGIVAGSYSSIFIASQLLVVWEKGEWRRFLHMPFARRAP